MKTIGQQIHVMQRHWPQFRVVDRKNDYVAWIGPLVGIERPYKLVVEYGLPVPGEVGEMFRRFPAVRVLSPALVPNFDAAEEAPLPHVYFDEHDLQHSPLCLFDPANNEWSPNDFIARTTIPWAADWLACYEGWQATGRWFGGGRHASSTEDAEVPA